MNSCYLFVKRVDDTGELLASIISARKHRRTLKMRELISSAQCEVSDILGFFLDFLETMITSGGSAFLDEDSNSTLLRGM